MVAFLLGFAEGRKAASAMASLNLETMSEEEAVQAGEKQIRAHYRAKERSDAARAELQRVKKEVKDADWRKRRKEEEEEEPEDQEEEMPKKKVMKEAGSAIKRSDILPITMSLLMQAAQLVEKVRPLLDKLFLLLHPEECRAQPPDCSSVADCCPESSEVSAL